MMKAQSVGDQQQIHHQITAAQPQDSGVGQLHQFFKVKQRVKGQQHQAGQRDHNPQQRRLPRPARPFNQARIRIDDVAEDEEHPPEIRVGPVLIAGERNP